jgi:hypothetical protein
VSEKEKVRHRRVTSLTLSNDVLEMVEELSRLSGWNRSRCVEECVRLAYPNMVKRFKDLRKEVVSNAENAYWGNEYWKKVILGDIHADKWVSV